MQEVPGKFTVIENDGLLVILLTVGNNNPQPIASAELTASGGYRHLGALYLSEHVDRILKETRQETKGPS